MIEHLLARLAAAVSARRRLVVVIWVVLVLGTGWFSLHQSDKLSGGGWEVPGSSSDRAGKLLEGFPNYDGIRFAIFAEGSSAAQVQVAAERAAARIGRFRDLRRAGRPQSFLGGRALLLPLLYTGPSKAATDFATDLRRAVVSDAGGVSTRVIGEPAVYSNFLDVSKHQLAKAETIGFPLILIILLAVFGTAVAAVAPVVLGVAAVFLTGAAIYGLSSVAEMSIYVTNMASMIGIGVAVDYSLFVVSRFRRSLREGRPSREALEDALESAGAAVVFSGATVVVSLASLFLIDVNALRSMAAGAIVVVSVAVLATVTLLPALLALTERRIERLRVPFRRCRRTEAGHDFWTAWTGLVMRRPALSLVLGVAVMAGFATPIFALHAETHGLSQLPKDAEVRQATERAGALAGPGFAGPMHVIVDNLAAAEEISSSVRRLRGVASVTGPIPSSDGSHYLVETVLGADPESSGARAVEARAATAAAEAARHHGAHAVVGGTTAFTRDVERALVGGLWKILLFVLAFSYVVLLLLLRSVLLPLKAVLMNLLSVGAAYGVLVAVFQWGWLDWTGYRSPGHLDTIVPALVLAVTFGLSMDYEVFLLTRIRERYARGVGSERAVAEGLASSASVITAAALIMVVVFGAFAIAGAPVLKELGVGLAAAILLDATIVRLVIVPATMRLLGEWNWWLPRPLARVLRTPRPAVTG
jgi:RND superfamily putative drug exporter